MRTCGQCQVNYPDAVEFCPRDGSKLPEPETRPPPDPLIGSTIDGRYLVEADIGHGGMGVVYAGRHAIIDKRVAIKVLKAEHARGDDSAGQRFLVEAKAASKIGHQNIVDITDFGVLPTGQAYFVMEFLDGPTLGKVVHQHGHLPPERAIGITVQIARGLQAAHEKGIVHRDLKPENIFILERDGQSDIVKVVDFGIAKDQAYKKKLTQAGMVLGTPEYMSPEQATGQPTDHRVDIYALGCMLYEMLIGDVPFRGENATQTLTFHAFEAPIAPSRRRPDLRIPPAIEAVVMRALAKKPAERFGDLREMMTALEQADDELRRLGPRPAPSTVQETEIVDELEAVLAGRRRIRRALAIAAGGAIAVVALVVALAAHGRHASPPATPPLAVAAPAAAPARPAVPAPAPALPAEVEITLRSVPAGAQVFEGGRRIGVAPLQIERPRSERELAFTFRRSGYREETRRVVPQSDVDLEVVLSRHDRVASSKGTHRSSSPPTKRPPPPRRVSDLRNPFD